MSDIYNSSFKAFYRRKLLKSIAQFKTTKSDSSSDCTEWKGGLDKGNYPILKKTFKYKRYNLRVQRLLYYLESPLEWLDPKIHVSHLCHNRQCLNLEHLSYEPAAVNYQRKTCLSEGTCLGHKHFRNCILQALVGRNHDIADIISTAALSSVVLLLLKLRMMALISEWRSQSRKIETPSANADVEFSESSVS